MKAPFTVRRGEDVVARLDRVCRQTDPKTIRVDQERKLVSPDMDLWLTARGVWNFSRPEADRQSSYCARKNVAPLCSDLPPFNGGSEPNVWTAWFIAFGAAAKWELGVDPKLQASGFAVPTWLDFRQMMSQPLGTRSARRQIDGGTASPPRRRQDL